MGMMSHLKTMKQFQVTRQEQASAPGPPGPPGLPGALGLLQPLEALRAVFEGTIEATHLRVGGVHAERLVLLDVTNPETCGETCGKKSSS